MTLDGEAECDEVYVVAEHKGNPEAVKKKGEKADADVRKEHVVVARWRKKSRQSSA